MMVVCTSNMVSKVSPWQATVFSQADRRPTGDAQVFSTLPYDWEWRDHTRHPGDDLRDQMGGGLRSAPPGTGGAKPALLTAEREQQFLRERSCRKRSVGLPG